MGRVLDHNGDDDGRYRRGERKRLGDVARCCDRLALNDK